MNKQPRLYRLRMTEIHSKTQLALASLHSNLSSIFNKAAVLRVCAGSHTSVQNAKHYFEGIKEENYEEKAVYYA